MSVDPKTSLSLGYGKDQYFDFEIDSDRLLSVHPTPEAAESFADDVIDALEVPLDFPALEQAIVPGDRIGIALDRGTPQAASIIAAVWDVFEAREIRAEDVTIIQPAALLTSEMPDPRIELPDGVREQVGWKIHDPTDDKARGYLASSSSGERIYLARAITDSDFVLPIGWMGFDPLLGYRGTASVFYPWLSTPEAIGKCHGQGHRELSPRDQRPLRELVDEISWLLGVQFTVQVVPTAGGQATQVFAGAIDSVFREGQSTLWDDWAVQTHIRPEVVVVTLQDDGGLSNQWSQLGAALSTARSLVAPDGKIVVLSDIDPEVADGTRIIQASDSPRDALKPLRTEAPADLIPATQIVSACDWAQVFLLSRLPGTLVEDLFMIPLENESEAQRLLADVEESCIVIPSAQYSYGAFVAE